MVDSAAELRAFFIWLHLSLTGEDVPMSARDSITPSQNCALLGALVNSSVLNRTRFFGCGRPRCCEGVGDLVW